ncbi:MAG: fasciclin domain-containing protein [Hyphomonadaceae bacterium]|nr:fasciclin domain-containing protein [Hyphomonadaceae bacterium]
MKSNTLAASANALAAHNKSAPGVVSVADRAGFHIFALALRNSDYLTVLEGPGPFTMFAPTDAAFSKFAPKALNTLLNEDSALLHAVLGHHFAKGKVASARFAGKRIRAVMHAGGDVIIDGRARLRVNNAFIVKPDLQASNGIVHGIDAVLWPREPAAVVAR